MSCVSSRFGGSSPGSRPLGSRTSPGPLPVPPRRHPQPPAGPAAARTRNAAPSSLRWARPPRHLQSRPGSIRSPADLRPPLVSRYSVSPGTPRGSAAPHVSSTPTAGHARPVGGAPEAGHGAAVAPRSPSHAWRTTARPGGLLQVVPAGWNSQPASAPPPKV